MKGFLSGVLFTLVALLALFLAPEQSLLETWTSRTFETHLPSPSRQVAVFITGCSSGIGLHAARYLAERGYDVFATVRREADVSTLTQHDDEATSRRIHPVICDVTDAEHIQQARDTVSQWLKRSSKDKERVFGGIVNNAGVVSPMVMFQSMPVQDLQRVLDVNLFGPFSTYQAFLPLIREYKGRILNVGSLAGTMARPFRGSYTVSKFALEGFSDTIRQELLLENISVSMINPGYVQTDLATKGMKISHSTYGETERRDDLTEQQKGLLDAFESKYVRTLADAPTPAVTSEAILHALSDPKPRTRYFPGSCGMGNAPASLIPKLKQIMPDRIGDRMVVKVTASESKDG